MWGIRGSEMKQLGALKNPYRKDVPTPWYSPSHRVRTDSAAQEAIRIEEWICRGAGGEQDPSETELFRALHTCAFRSGGNRRARPDSPRKRALWGRRWLIIREHIVHRNLGLVYTMMRRYRFKDLDNDDMLSEGLFALSRSVERFDPWKGYRFSTYVCNSIARAWGRRGEKETRYRRLLPVAHSVAVEEPERIDTGTELYVERLQRALNENLADLTRRESQVLANRFPPDRAPRRTLQQVARAMGLSKERVRQIQNGALKKLRNVLEGDPILQ